MRRAHGPGAHRDVASVCPIRARHAAVLNRVGCAPPADSGMTAQIRRRLVQQPQT